MSWDVRLAKNRIEIGERFAISFQRTLRIPDDGKAYPLPPTLGVFPLRRVDDFAAHLPVQWSRPGEPPAFFIPMYQREALWLAFEAASWKPNAVKIGIGKINALTLPVILDWLARHDIPFDEVHVGKPWCGTDGFYVDDKAVRPSEFVTLGYEEIRARLAREP